MSALRPTSPRMPFEGPRPPFVCLVRLYIFTPNALTVKFHDDRPANAFKITKYTYTNDSVRIDWLNADGKESVTVFAEFSGSNMAQQEEGDKPRRAFHRC